MLRQLLRPFWLASISFLNKGQAAAFGPHGLCSLSALLPGSQGPCLVLDTNGIVDSLQVQPHLGTTWPGAASHWVATHSCHAVEQYRQAAASMLYWPQSAWFRICATRPDQTLGFRTLHFCTRALAWAGFSKPECLPKILLIETAGKVLKSC